MREQTAAAPWIRQPLAAIGGGFEHVDCRRESEARLDAFDGREDALAWNRPAHEHDLTVAAGDHPTAVGRLLDREFQLLADGNHVTGSR
jgi:hypothetical protein